MRESLEILGYRLENKLIVKQGDFTSHIATKPKRKTCKELLRPIGDL